VLRAQAAIPEDVVLLTKPQIALALLRRVRSWGLPPATVCADPGYCDLNVLGELDGQGRSFCLGAAADFGVRLPGGSGEVCRVDHLRAALPERLWPAVTYREGTKEPLSKEFAAVEVQAATAQASGPRVWLLLERPLPGEPGDPKQYVLNADPTYTLQQMACLAHRRPVSERFSYENGKDQVGLADYQGRTWPGFHHHLALVMLALTWLNLQRRPLPTSRDGGAPRPPAPARSPRAPSAPRGATVLQSGRRVTLRTAPVAPLPPAPPRLIWESVQAVRRRFVAWCQMMVVITLAPRIHRRDLPAFAHLG
jgi:SRSO17 transposase